MGSRQGNFVDRTPHRLSGARPLRLLATRQDRTRGAAAAQEPQPGRRGGLKEALPSNSVPLLLRPQEGRPK